MGTEDYICVTLSGGAPWGFSLQRHAPEHPQLLTLSQVEPGGPAAEAGLCEGDELLSVNGLSCTGLSPPEVTALVDGTSASLQLLVSRTRVSEELLSSKEQGFFEKRKSEEEEGLESTTLEIWPARHSLLHGELHICDSQDESEAYSGEAESDTDTLGHTCRGCSRELDAFSPGAVVELQLSLSDHSADDAGDPAALTDLSGPQAVVHTTTFSHAICAPAPTSQPQVEVTLQWSHRGCQEAGPEERGVESEASGKGGSSEEGVPKEVPSPSVVSLSSSAEELDSEPEKDPGKPNKHRARHARFRRSESQSEKQVKEAKCKSRRIALLLTAAPNPNNKGVLMFKKHRQRAKKYTLISYGTGEDASEDEDGEDGEDGGQVAKEKHTVKLTLLANSESELGEEHFVDAQGCSSTVTFDWDTGLLDIERKLEDLQEMDRLPETKGKGALMFAQRRQRMDEISAEHDEMRRKGMPVEGVQEIQSSSVLKMGPYQAEEQSYVQSVESRVYMDVNLQQQHQYQQQQQQYQQQLQQQEYQEQQYQQQQYEQHQYQQLQQYQHSMNGVMHHQANDSQKSTIITNRTAKPFSGVQNTVPSPFPPSRGVSSEDQAGYIESQYSMVPPQSCSLMSSGEQIASRDERISVPAIRTGILQDTRKRSPSKPMFTFKEPPKVSPNPELLNLLNRNDKKTGFESGPEEDYLSLGAEACNFLQAPKAKQKIPPPVAPKPVINPASPPWSPPPESSSQVPSHSGEHSTTAALSVSSPGTASAPILEKAPPTQLHATEDSQSLPEAQGYSNQSNMRSPPQDQELFRQPESAPVSGPQSQTDAQPPVSSWTPAQMQAQPQPPVSAWTQPPTQAHPQARACIRAPSQPQPSPQQQPVNTWNQPQTQADSQPHESTWTQPQIQAQPQAPANTWTPSQPQPEPQAPVEAWSPAHVQTQQQPTWSSPAYPQPKPQSSVSSWSAAQSQSPHSAWTPGQTQGHAQSNWASSLQAPSPQSQPKAQSHVSSWPPPQPQPQAQLQSQSPWTSQMQQQPQEQVKSQSYVSSWPPVQTQAPSQPPWVSSQSQAQQQAQMSSWASETHQIHPEPIGNSWAPAQRECQQQPSWISPPQHQTPLQTSVTQWSPALGQGQAQPQPQPPASTWTPAQTQSPSQLPWASTQQPSMSVWAPHTQQALLSATTFSQVPPSSQQPLKPWNQPQSATSSTAPPPPPQRMNSYTPSSPAITGGLGSAFEMPALRGKGAELFAKRQSRMEKFVVDSSTVQANKVRSVSPTPSLPSSWKYTPNIRAPPPLSYNPIQSPSYPPGAVKQAPASSPAASAKGKGKEKAALKPLHALDVMKHQPYQLNSSLFTYGPAVEVKGPPAKPALTPTSVQSVKYEQFAPTQPSGPMNSPYPLQAPYGTANVSSSVQDGPYHQGPSSSYQTGPNFQFNQHPSNPYRQPPDHYYQPMSSPPYQPDQNPPYQQAQNPAYLQPQSSPYQAGSIPSYEMGQDTPYQEAPALSYQSGPNVYASPSFQVPPKPASVSGAGPSVAPRPKFSAKKSAAQVWKPSAVAQE